MTRMRCAACLGLLVIGSLVSPVRRAGAQSTTDTDPSYYRVRSSRRINDDGRQILELRVLVSHALGRTRALVIKLSRQLCHSGTCVLRYWESDDSIPHTDSALTPAQSASSIGRYRIDRDTAFERLECYAYGDPSEGC